MQLRHGCDTLTSHPPWRRRRRRCARTPPRLGPCAESQEERFQRLVRYSGAPGDVVFYKEIRLTADAAGMGRLSDAKIDGYVQTLYGIQALRPSKFVNGRRVQDRGFKGLVLFDAGFDERAERVKRAKVAPTRVQR